MKNNSFCKENYNYENLPLDFGHFYLYLNNKIREAVEENETENLILLYREIPYFYEHLETKLETMVFIKDFKVEKNSFRYDKIGFINKFNSLEKIIEVKLKTEKFVKNLL